MLAAPATARGAQLELSVEMPVVGEPVDIALGAGIDSVFVTYRPGSRIEAMEAFATGGDSVLRWTPSRAGLVRIVASGGEERYVSVKFETVPASGVGMLVLAGTILFGGAALGFRRLMK